MARPQLLLLVLSFPLFFFFETKLSLLLSITTSTIAVSNTTYEDFIQCFSHYTSSNLTIYTPNTTAFNTILMSSVNNLRILNSCQKPALIVTPTHESHVQAAVICSKKNGLRIRVRSGGHDYEGLSYCSHGDPFVTVDLNKLSSINIDEEKRVAWVQAGATLGELYYNIANKSRIIGFPAGICPTVGVGGHFSGGGIGSMTRKYGLASDQIIDARFMDVNGKILSRESMGDDLFWAIRGGGGASFGIILAYKIKLVYVPPKVTVFTVSRTLDQGATKLVTRWQQIAYKMHENLFIRAIIQVMDDENVKGNRTIQVLFNSLFLGSQKKLLPLMGRSFPELGLEAKDCIEMSWIESVAYSAGFSNQTLDVLLNRNSQTNISIKSKSDFLEEPISESGWEGIWKWFLQGEQHLIMIIEPFGGRMHEIPENSSPFPHRNGSLYNVQYFMKWVEGGPVESNKHIRWLRNFYMKMTPFVSKNPRAAYINYKDLDLGRNERGRTSYSRASIWGRKYFKNNFRRLAYVKGKVDPDDFFRNEQSIPPLIKM